jgi:hypothetical protein
VLRFESDTAADLERIKADFRQALHGLLPDLALPF